MVLESLTTPAGAEHRPFLVFLLGAGYGTIALVLALWIFEEQSSMVMIFLASSAAIPLMYHLLHFEEKKDIVAPTKSLLHNHSRALMFYLMLFLGMAVAFSIWYVVLPAEITANVFKVQTDTITNLNQNVAGGKLTQHLTGQVTQTSLLSKIFLNNVKVMIFCILFSFLYGSGALFILTWNASVIGAAVGNFIRAHMATFADAAGAAKAGAYFYVSSLSVLRYAVHGVPEIVSYLLAGLAGGILSMAIIQKDFGTNQFEQVLLDVSDLVLLSVLVLFIAALIEVFVTPALF